MAVDTSLGPFNPSFEPIPQGPVVDPKTGALTGWWRNHLEGGRTRNGEIISGINRNRANIVQLETDYTAADGVVSSAYISADAVVAADAEGARAALSTTLTTAYEAADATIQADVNTRATISYVDSVESTLEGSIAGQYTTITAEYTAITDTKARTFSQTTAPTATATGDLWIDTDDDNKLYRWSGSAWVAMPDARIATNAASITTEESARASGDSANATSITTLEARVSNAGEILNPNPNFTYPSATPGAPFGWLGLNSSGLQTADDVRGGVTVGKLLFCVCSASADTGPYVTVDVSGSRKYRIRFIAQRTLGELTTSAIVVAWSTGTGGYTFNLASTAPVDGVASATPTARQVWEFEVDSPSGATTCTLYGLMHWQGGYGTAASPAQLRIYELSIAPINGTQAQVTNIAEAYATDSSSTARLVWTVNTSTNAATIEQTAAEGYTDGTWNGSAISLTADEISLRANALNLGTDTTFEDTHDTFYTISGSYRFRYSGPFGTSSDLLLWYGLNSVALNSETKTNGVFAMATDGKVYFGSTVAATPISISRTNGFVKTKIGSGTNTTNSVSFSATGGNGSYTFTHELAIGSTSGPSASVSSASGSPITVSASGAPVDTVYGTVITTCTDGNGLKAQISSPVALFWET